MKLGVNIDHVATLRNARGGVDPDIIKAASLVMQAGADHITIHLREDRRHIKDADLADLAAKDFPLNLEIAPNEEMVNIAIGYDLLSICLVPERREEITTENGLDVIKNASKIEKIIKKFKDKNIKTSLFIDCNKQQIEKSIELGADMIELHMGDYANLVLEGDRKKINSKITLIKNLVEEYGDKIDIHAGHGLNLFNILPLLSMKEIKEYNIGHAIIAEAIFEGLFNIVRSYKKLLAENEAI